MKPLFVLFLTMLTLSSVGQTKLPELNGKWKILSMNDRDVYYNFKKDSGILKNSDFANGMDTSLGMQYFKQTMLLMKSTYFIFSENNLLEIKGIDSVQKAHYTIDTSGDKKVLSYTRTRDSFVDKFYISIDKNLLYLISIDNSEYTMIFERE